MTNYLNQIESDLYKLNSITNGSGEVVEMVAEIKEKYQKAEAFDQIREARKEVLTDVRERGFNIPADQDKFTLWSENIINKYESGGYDA